MDDLVAGEGCGDQVGHEPVDVGEPVAVPGVVFEVEQLVGGGVGDGGDEANVSHGCSV